MISLADAYVHAIVVAIVAFVAGLWLGWYARESRYRKQLGAPDPATLRTPPGAAGKV